MATSSRSDEPTPASGHIMPPQMVGVAGAKNLIDALTNDANAARELAAELRKTRESDPNRSGDAHAARFANHPSAKQQWEDYRAKRQAAVDAARARKQEDLQRQQASQVLRSMPQQQQDTARASAGEALRQAATQAGQTRIEPLLATFPRMGVTPGIGPASTTASTGTPGQPGLMAQRAGTAGGNWGAVATQYARQQLVLPTPGQGGGPPLPRRGGPPGGWRVNGGGGGAGGGGGGLGGAIGIGVAAGVAQAGAQALSNYSNRNLNQDYDQFGNLYIMRNGGYSGRSYGSASQQGIRQLLPVRNEATSPSDLIAGGAQIFVNAGSNATFSQNLTNAGVSAALTPGLGIAGAANIQQAEGSNRGNLAAMMLTGQGTRRPGDQQISDVQLANQLLSATRPGKGTEGLTSDKLRAMLSQTGSLRANLNAYGDLSGLGSEGVQSLADILTAQTAYQEKYGSTEGFEQTVKDASAGNAVARAKLKGTGILESTQQSIMSRQGSQIKRDVDTQKDFIDALKASNSAMMHFSDAVTSFLNGTGLGRVLGVGGGLNAGIGGRISGAAGGAAAGAIMGSAFFGIGAVPGALIGGAAGFIAGGRAGDGPTPSSPDNSGQNKQSASVGVSQAANTAIAFAQAQRGKPYVMGAVGPNAYDCSGLTQAAYKAAGVSIPRVSSEQYQFGKEVPLDQIAPGDLIFPKGEDGMWGAPPGLPGHVMMALGPGPNVPVVQAGSPSTGIFDSTISISQIKGARRVTNGVGTVAPNLNKTPSGNPTTNATTAAGTAQVPASHPAFGMNEVDVLGSVIGRAAWQGPSSSPNSSQSTSQSGAVNGSADKRPGYAKGAYSINGDQTADLHDGEMVLDSKLSRSVRSAIMADIPRHTSAGKSTAPTLNFTSGSVVINVTGGATPSAMQSAARQFVDAVAADNRIQMIGGGL